MAHAKRFAAMCTGFMVLSRHGAHGLWPFLSSVGQPWRRHRAFFDAPIQQKPNDGASASIAVT